MHLNTQKYRLHKAMLAGGAGLLVLLLPALAFFRASGQKDTVRTSIGSVGGMLLETSPRGGEDGVPAADNWKECYVLATGSKASIVRMKFVCSAHVKQEDGSYTPVEVEEAATKKTMDIKDVPFEYNANGEPAAGSPFTYTITDHEDWIFNQADGYWYYTGVLNKNGLADSLSDEEMNKMGYIISEEDGVSKWIYDPAASTGTADQDPNLHKKQQHINYALTTYKPNTEETPTALTTSVIHMKDIAIGGHTVLHPDDQCEGNTYRIYNRENTRISVNVVMEICQATNGNYLLSWGNVDESIISQIDGGSVWDDCQRALENEEALDSSRQVLHDALAAG